MTQDEQKQAVAREAIKYVEDDAIIGVGTGSTANFFIDELAKIKHRIKGAVASSVKTAERLKGHGIYVEELNNVADLPVYVDGADEVTEHGAMIKGGGGALTREKIVAAVARKFVCIADGSKLVGVLGTFPLPVEVIPMARSYVARQLVLLGGQPAWRMGFTTDNGNVILDVHGLRSRTRSRLEARSAGSSAWSPSAFSPRAEPTILLGTDAGVRRSSRRASVRAAARRPRAADGRAEAGRPVAPARPRERSPTSSPARRRSPSLPCTSPRRDRPWR